MTKTQVDKLGERIKEGRTTEEDLRILDSYRRSFGDAYEQVIGDIRGKLELSPTGRPTKSTTSISEKLRREHIRLSQMQDIAGCRLIVESIIEQDVVNESLKQLFHNIKVVDRRELPSYGYRAVHYIAMIEEKTVEIQVRTLLQHLWAELSEKLADVIDPTIKYGGGKEAICKPLRESSQLVAKLEQVEKQMEENEVTRKAIRASLEKTEKGIIAARIELHAQLDSDNPDTQERQAQIDHLEEELGTLMKQFEESGSITRQARNDARQKMIANYEELLNSVRKK